MEYLPTRECDLRSWSQNLVDMIDIGGVPQFGLSAQQVAEYAALHGEFSVLLTASLGNSTRTPSVVRAKNQSKKALTKKAREIVQVIQANPTTTDPDRAALNIPIRRATRAAVEAPPLWPMIDVTAVAGYRVRVRLADMEHPKNGRKPEGVLGANILTHIGPEEPKSPGEWSFHGNATRLRFDVDFPRTLPEATKVWISAIWFNSRGELSQRSPGVGAFVGISAAHAA